MVHVHGAGRVFEGPGCVEHGTLSTSWSRVQIPPITNAISAKLPYTSPPQKSMYWNQSIDSIHPTENNKSSTLSGVGLCKVRLDLFDKENNTQFNI
jgi:hypothetical protein